MPKQKTEVIDSFGQRLDSLRKAAGFAQVEFAAEVGTPSGWWPITRPRTPSLRGSLTKPIYPHAF